MGSASGEPSPHAAEPSGLVEVVWGELALARGRISDARSARGVLLPGLLLLLVCGAALAQTTGEIIGSVTDVSEDALPGATVSATSPSLQGTRRTVTARDGTYRIPALPPGVYRVEAAAPGFAAVERAAVVSLGATAAVNITLSPSLEERIVISGEAPLLNMTSTVGGTNYSADVLSRLPLQRNYADVVRSNPGVLQDFGRGQLRFPPLAIYGASSVENQWVVDGIATTDVQKGIQGKILNVEAVEEVEVKTGGYQAEYGRALGGVINMITKSGGNQFHGGGFLYYDRLGMSARPVVTGKDLATIAGMRVASYHRTDVGADLGGYILKDRLWFFGSYDHVESPGTVSRNQPSELVPTTMEFPLSGTENTYSGKVTWNVSRGTTLVASALGDPAVSEGAGRADPAQGIYLVTEIFNPDPATWQTNRSFGGLDAGLRWNQLFGSSGLMTIHVSHHHDHFELEAAGPALATQYLDFRCDGGTPEEPCFFALKGITGGIGPLGGPDNRSESKRDQYRGDLSLFRGSHEVKLGGDYLSAGTRIVEAYSGGQRVSIQNERGTLYYRHFFYAKSATELIPVDSVLRPKTFDLSAYAQDSWRIGPRWTVTAGLRWDGQDIRDYADQMVIRTSAWQPRLGVIWDPIGGGRTKVYAFAGRFSYALPTDLTARAFGALTAANVYNFDPIGVVPDPTVPFHPRSGVAGGAYAPPVDAELSAAYQDELTVGVERALAPGFSVALKGTYRRLGRVIEDRCDLDSNRPETNYNSCGIMNPGSGEPIARGGIPGCNYLNDPYYECTDTIPGTPPARRLYRGIEILTRKSTGEKLWLQGSYVYSSLRGNFDGGVRDSGRLTPGSSLDFNFPASTHNGYGRLLLDRPHSLRFDGSWLTPWRARIGLGAYWQSGAPFSRNGYYSDYAPVNVYLDQRGDTSRMPSIWEADLTLAYPIKIGGATVTAQAFVYDLFNNQLPTHLYTSWAAFEPPGYPESIFDPKQPQTDNYYGLIVGRQSPRTWRAAVKVSF